MGDGKGKLALGFGRHDSSKRGNQSVAIILSVSDIMYSNLRNIA